MSFAGRTVLVTGATGNLGRAVAQAFLAREANVVLLARRKDALREAFGEPSSRRHHVAADLADAAQVEAAVGDALARFGAIDALCNVAGGFRMGEPVHTTPDTAWDAMQDVNVRSVLHTARAVVPRMLEAGRGRIVNVAAFGALRGGARMGAYAASKSAVIRLTESMAAELRERNINVNCVLPTIIDTPENRAAMPEADPAKWVAPDDLAAVIVFLASDAARAIHGAALPVAGLS